MTWRTPSSLKWLITRRSRISGALLKLEDELKQLQLEIQERDIRVAKFRKQLAALDQTLGLHEIYIDPCIIQPVRPRERPRLLPHGKMTGFILSELRKTGTWLSTSEIVTRFVSHFSSIECLDSMTVRHRVRLRLRGLVRRGLIERQITYLADGKHDGISEVFWRLPHGQD